ncbi:MAG: nucleotidyltransferase family protein [Myxococcales bacterium]|nr:nucleotidyltransferase family protein [Myxococcales bacterium]
MSPTNEGPLLQFLGWILRGESGDVPNEVGSALPAKRVRAHRLAPLAHSAGLAGYRDDFIHAALAAELWKQGLAQVLTAFDDAGIDACRLKGCAYFDSLYKDPAHRLMGDMDILVRPESFDTAGHVLKQLGFVPRTTKEFAYAPSHHALTFDRASLTVDLHRHIMQAGRSKIDIQGIWRRADLTNHRPAVADEIVLHLAHMIRSELMIPLASFVDLTMLLRQGGIERGALMEQCRSARIGRGARIVFAMLDVLTRGCGGRAYPYPVPSAEELASEIHLLRYRQLLVKALLVEGPRELAGLALTTARERTRRWR